MAGKDLVAWASALLGRSVTKVEEVRRSSQAPPGARSLA